MGAKALKSNTFLKHLDALKIGEVETKRKVSPILPVLS